jgi:hypothetical protein
MIALRCSISCNYYVSFLTLLKTFLFPIKYYRVTTNRYVVDLIIAAIIGLYIEFFCTSIK